MQMHRVQSLLMGGQACVFYGGAEFSRDTDLALLAEEGNLKRLRSALDELRASPISVPPLSIEVLERGHAVHFRCGHPDVARMRIDVMSRMRGVDPFEKLWERRTTARIDDGFMLDLLSLPDLVAAKKTQRDKDWPMIRRLIESDYFAHRDQARPEQIAFWLAELRTPTILIEVGSRWPEAADHARRSRPLLSLALPEKVDELAAAIEEEQRVEKAKDQAYWKPRRAELDRWRREQQ